MCNRIDAKLVINIFTFLCYSYLGTTLRQANIEPMPSLSDVRRVITEFAIMPLGKYTTLTSVPMRARHALTHALPHVLRRNGSRSGAFAHADVCTSGAAYLKKIVKPHNGEKFGRDVRLLLFLRSQTTTKMVNIFLT